VVIQGWVEVLIKGYIISAKTGRISARDLLYNVGTKTNNILVKNAKCVFSIPHVRTV
jgi:hypothetical protein